jgi:5-hydroxyisourate hydrolase-like protein (transthyretin family)
MHKTQKTNGGQWNYLTEAELQKDGVITITMNDSAAGVVAADAFRVLYRGEVSSVEKEIPEQFVLKQNYPNPFNPSTTIQFQLRNTSNVELKVYNTLGQLVTTLVDQKMGKGNHQVIFNSKEYGNLASGVYYYKLKAGDYSKTKGMVLIK